MAKDINIKVKTEGVDQAAQQIGKVAESVETLNKAQRDSFEAAQLAEEKATGVTDALDKMGDASIRAGQDQKDFADYLKQTAGSAKEAGDAVQGAGAAATTGFDQAAQKGSALTRIVDGIGNSAFRMVTGFLGIGGVLKLISALNDQLTKMRETQGELVGKYLTATEGGQILEAATGTVGKQGYWTQEIGELQKIGGLRSPDLALEMMLQANKSFGAAGGIRNQSVVALLQRLAPSVGAAAISKSDFERIFKDEEKSMEDAWKAELEKQGKKSSGSPEFTVPASRFEQILRKKLGTTDAQGRAFLESPLGMAQTANANEGLEGIRAAPEFLDWEQILKDAESEYGRRSIKGENPVLIFKSRETLGIALRDLAEKRKRMGASRREVLDIEGMARYVTNPLFQMDPWTAKDAYKFGAEMVQKGNIDTDAPPGVQLPIQDLDVQGEFEITDERRKKTKEGTGRVSGAKEPARGPGIGKKVDDTHLLQVREGPGPVTINNDYSRKTIYMPRVGYDQFRERFSQSDA
jgi:hypothetical protein